MKYRSNLYRIGLTLKYVAQVGGRYSLNQFFTRTRMRPIGYPLLLVPAVGHHHVTQNS